MAHREPSQGSPSAHAAPGQPQQPSSCLDLLWLADDSLVRVHSRHLTLTLACWTPDRHATFALPATRFRLDERTPLSHAAIPYRPASLRPRLLSQLALHHTQSVLHVSASPAGFGPLHRCCLLVLGSNGYIGVVALHPGDVLKETCSLSHFELPVWDKTAAGVALGLQRPSTGAWFPHAARSIKSGGDSYSGLFAVCTRSAYGHVALFSLSRLGVATLVGGFDLGLGMFASAIAFHAGARAVVAVGAADGQVSLWGLRASKHTLLVRCEVWRRVDFGPGALSRAVTGLVWTADEHDLLAIARGCQLVVAEPFAHSTSGEAPLKPHSQEPCARALPICGMCWVPSDFGPLLLTRTRGGLDAFRVVMPAAFCEPWEWPFSAPPERVAAVARSPAGIGLLVVQEDGALCELVSAASNGLALAAATARQRGVVSRREAAMLSDAVAAGGPPQDVFQLAVLTAHLRVPSARLRRVCERIHAQAMLEEASQATKPSVLSWVSRVAQMRGAREEDDEWAPKLDALRKLAEEACIRSGGSTLDVERLRKGADADRLEGRRCAWSLEPVEAGGGCLECETCQARVKAGLALGARGEWGLLVPPLCPLCAGAL